MFSLATNTVSLLFKAPSSRLEQKFRAVPFSSLFVCSIVEAEIRYGIAKKRWEATKLSGVVDQFLSSVTILPWTSSTAKKFARLRTDAEATGVTIATVDLMIAAHAQEHDLTLVTHDGALLRLRPWLRVVDWAG